MTGLFGVHHGSDGMYWESRESSRDATCLDSSINGVRSSQLLIQGSTISPLHGPPHCSQAANKPLTGRCLLSLSSVLLSTLVTANGTGFLLSPPHRLPPGRSTAHWHRAWLPPSQLTVPHSTGRFVCLHSIPYLFLQSPQLFGQASCSFLTSAKYWSACEVLSPLLSVLLVHCPAFP
jgi:hypothetical protein